ncbi:flippase activity-associated protein Agl23, partial [Chloroflexota bacterium]
MRTAPLKSKTRAWLDRLIPPSKINWEIFLFSIIIFAAAFTRFYDLGARVMSHDESLHTYYSWLFFKTGNFQHSPMIHGPLQFHLLALTYNLFGDSDFTSRIPVAIASVTAVAFLWNFRRYLGRTGASITASLFVISPFMLFYGRYVRNEAFVALFGLVTFWVILRYLETGYTCYLYGITVITALHFAAKETAFIFTAQILLFLGILFLSQILKQPWSKPKFRNIFNSLLLFVAILCFTAIILPGQIIWAIAILALFIATGILLSGFGLSKLRNNRSFGLISLLFGLVLPHLVALPIHLAGWDPLNYFSLENILRIAYALVPMFGLSGVFLMLWNPRRWWLHLLIFYSIFTLLFTSLFTYWPGFFTGLVGSLGYWLAQQGLRRGAQPFYYYFLVQIPVYEYLAAAGTILAAFLGLRLRSSRKSKPNNPKSLNIGAQQAAPGSSPFNDSPASSNISPHLSLMLLGFWIITSLIAYTIAGEKMPWLTIHILLPMLMLTGWALGSLVDCLRQPNANAKQILHIATLLFFIFLAALTLRASLTAAYINYDLATEYLVYAHSTADVKEIMTQIDSLSQAVTGG